MILLIYNYISSYVVFRFCSPFGARSTAACTGRLHEIISHAYSLVSLGRVHTSLDKFTVLADFVFTDFLLWPLVVIISEIKVSKIYTYGGVKF